MKECTKKFHNNGVWFVGKNRRSICSTKPQAGESDSFESVKYYGGHLIAESMHAPDAVIASFAPDMWQLLVDMHRDFGGGLPRVEKMLCDIWIAQNTEKFR